MRTNERVRREVANKGAVVSKESQFPKDVFARLVYALLANFAARPVWQSCSFTRQSFFLLLLETGMKEYASDQSRILVSDLS